MAKYSLNDTAVAKARALIDARQYVLDSDWGEVAPGADDENAFLKSHSWDEYAEWHLGLTESPVDLTENLVDSLVASGLLEPQEADGVEQAVLDRIRPEPTTTTVTSAPTPTPTAPATPRAPVVRARIELTG